MDEAPQLARRAFLQHAGGVVGIAATVSLCDGCAWFHKRDIQVQAAPEATSVVIALAAHPGLREPGGFVRVSARDGDLRIILLRRPDRTLVALSMRCTHWGCDVDWKQGGGEFECPCHGSRFDADGKVLEGPADEPLARFDVTESADIVTLAFAPPR